MSVFKAGLDPESLGVDVSSLDGLPLSSNGQHLSFNLDDSLSLDSVRIRRKIIRTVFHVVYHHVHSHEQCTLV